MKRRFWAYLSTEEKVKIHAYRGNRAAIEAAYESDLVDDVLEPYEAENIEQAMEIARRRLKPPQER